MDSCPPVWTPQIAYFTCFGPSLLKAAGDWTLLVHLALLWLQNISFSLSLSVCLSPFVSLCVSVSVLSQPVPTGHRVPSRCGLMWSSQTISGWPFDFQHFTLSRTQKTGQGFFFFDNRSRYENKPPHSFGCMFKIQPTKQGLSKLIHKQKARASL